MSGIGGVWRRHNPLQTAAAVRAISQRLAMAPLERQAQQCAGEAGVGVAARFAGQQIYASDRVLLACDADLINEPELWQLAGSKPAEGELDGTARLLATLYAKLGPSFLTKLAGGFAVLLWDATSRRWIAAIDGFGIKRLVYYRDRDTLAAATRIDALMQCGFVDAEVNPRAIANVLNFSSNLGPGTVFSRVGRLVPGVMLTVSEQGERLEKYWDMRYGTGTDSNVDRLSRGLEAVVEDSVGAHSKAGDPASIGAFLSGGTDSSTVVGMMSRLTTTPVKAFSIGFEEQHFNELMYAEIAAKRFGAEHHTYLVTAQDCLEALPEMIRYFDEPYGNSSAIPTFFCARLAAQKGIKTLLAGDGGDELFGGNERYAIDKIFEVYHRVPKLFRRGLIEPYVAAVSFPGPLMRRAKGYLRRANMPGVERMLSFQYLKTHALSEIFEPDFIGSLQNYDVVEVPAHHYAQAEARDHLDRLLYVDLKITLADNDLPKVTCMSELAGIQVRFPYLDRQVAEFSGSIPANLKVKGFKKRYLFKRAFRSLLPVEIIQKKKHGFGIPVARWINTDKRMRELSRDTLLSARASQRGYFRRGLMEELFRHSEGDDSYYYGDTIWTFLALELWHRQVVDQLSKVSA